MNKSKNMDTSIIGPTTEDTPAKAWVQTTAWTTGMSMDSINSVYISNSMGHHQQQGRQQ
jgi:hypothetical protein